MDWRGDISEHSWNISLSLHHTPDEFNHSVGNSAESPDDKNLQYSVGLGYRHRVTTYGIRIPVTVMNLVIVGSEADLSTCGGCEFHTPVTG